MRTNYRSGLVGATRAGTLDAAALLTMSFPIADGNLGQVLFAQIMSVPGLSAGLDYTAAWYANPTASFSGNITWVKVWMSTTSAANASVSIAAAMLTGSV